MISKELFSEVLGEEVLEIYGFTNSKTRLEYRLLSRVDGESINIYELAHKCKEWAYKRDTALISGMDYIDKSCFCNIWETDGIKFTVRGDTEPESIFKACQYILDK